MLNPETTAPAPSPYCAVDARLLSLATMLDDELRRRILTLVQADSRAVHLVDVEQRMRQAEDLAKECRRQLAGADRLLDRVKRALEVEHVDVDQLRRDLAVRPRSRPEFAATERPEAVSS